MSDAATRPVTVGILYPGHAAEDDYPAAEALLGDTVRLPVVHTSEGSDLHTVEALLDTGAPFRLRDGAERMRTHRPDAVLWACTSGSFVYGLDGARAQADAVGEQLGVPASSTSLAFIAALRAEGWHRVAVGATYPQPLTDRFTAFLEAAGMEVLHVGVLGIMLASGSGGVSREAAIRLARENDHPQAEVVLLPDTALHSIAWLDALEDAVGKPVLTANQVTIWEGLALAGHPLAERGPRRLFG